MSRHSATRPKATCAASVVIVVIGRNEGKRLENCLRSIVDEAQLVVYVDSGSTDGSAARARAMGAQVIELDSSRPYSAARARNAGANFVAAKSPPPEFIQFVDGDCEVFPGWIAAAETFLREKAEAGCVFGNLIEKNPDASVYNRMCQVEWNAPFGRVNFCGGIAMFRQIVISEAGGYNERIIAGEDTELCIRVRDRGWKVWHIDRDMARHDAAMTHFTQWWTRSVRAGHCFAQLGEAHQGQFFADRARAVLWGGILPLIAMLIAAVAPQYLSLVLGAYVVSYLRSFFSLRKRGENIPNALQQALFSLLSKLPNLQGIIKYHVRKAQHSEFEAIEYK